MTEELRENDQPESAFRPTGGAAFEQVPVNQHQLAEPRQQLGQLLEAEISGRPFTELAGVTFSQRGAELAGHLLLDTLEDLGYSTDDYDAVGALTGAAIPLVDAMLHAAASRGQDLDAFVMDFVYPSIKGPSLEGKWVILLDAWLSQKSYVQTSSLVTLRKGNELSLDCGIVTRQGGQILAIASLVGGLGGEDQAALDQADLRQADLNQPLTEQITVVDPVDDSRHSLPFISVFKEGLFLTGDSQAATGSTLASSPTSTSTPEQDQSAQ